MKNKKFKSAVNINASLNCLLLLTILVLSNRICIAQTSCKSKAAIKKTIIANMPEMSNFSTSVYKGKIYAFKYGPDHDIATNEDYKNAGSVFCFDPVTGRWDSKASMPVKKVSYRIASLNDKIYIIGGFTFKDTPSNSVEMYDPATNEWSIKSKMPTARCRIGIAVLENKLYTFGGLAQGVVTDAVEVFDPSDNEWIASDQALVYDPKTDTWEELEPLSEGKIGMAVEAIGNKIYVIGGEIMGPAGQSAQNKFSDKIEIYEIAEPETAEHTFPACGGSATMN